MSHAGMVARKKLRRAIATQMGALEPSTALKRKVQLRQRLLLLQEGGGRIPTPPMKERTRQQLLREGKLVYGPKTSGRIPPASLAESSNPKIQRMFHPHSEKGPVRGYPLYQIFHDFSKMPKEFVFNFVNLKKLLGIVRSDPIVGQLLRQHPWMEREIRTSVIDSVRERGIKAAKYWTNAPKSYIDKIVAGGKANPNIMNKHAGDIIAQKFGAEVRSRTILDVGSFSGGTIKGVVNALSPAQRKLLTIVLVDVNGSVVKEHAVPGLMELGVPRQNIKVIPANFLNAAVAFGKMPKPLHERGERAYLKEFIQLAGKVDAVVAGAATINFATDLKPYLRSIKTLLKKDGVFVNWDWGSAEVQAPVVNIPQLKEQVLGHAPDGRPVTGYDAYVSFIDFWMRSPYFSYPESVKQRLFAEIDAAERFDFMGWCEKHIEWIEKERIASGGAILADPAGFRNRAYRTPGSMYHAAKIIGMRPEKAMYPIAKPGERDTGNVNWMMVMEKRQ